MSSNQQSDRIVIARSLDENGGVISRKKALREIDARNMLPIKSYAPDEKTIEEVKTTKRFGHIEIKEIVRRVVEECEQCAEETLHENEYNSNGVEKCGSSTCMVCGETETWDTL